MVPPAAPGALTFDLIGDERKFARGRIARQHGNGSVIAGSHVEVPPVRTQQQVLGAIQPRIGQPAGNSAVVAQIAEPPIGRIAGEQQDCIAAFAGDIGEGAIRRQGERAGLDQGADAARSSDHVLLQLDFGRKKRIDDRAKHLRRGEAHVEGLREHEPEGFRRFHLGVGEDHHIDQGLDLARSDRRRAAVGLVVRPRRGGEVLGGEVEARFEGRTARQARPEARDRRAGRRLQHAYGLDAQLRHVVVIDDGADARCAGEHAVLGIDQLHREALGALDHGVATDLDVQALAQAAGRKTDPPGALDEVHAGAAAGSADGAAVGGLVVDVHRAQAGGVHAEGEAQRTGAGVAFEAADIVDGHCRAGAGVLRIDVEPARHAFGTDAGLRGQPLAQEDPHWIARARRTGHPRVQRRHRNAESELPAEAGIAPQGVSRQHIASRHAADFDQATDGRGLAEQGGRAIQHVIRRLDFSLRSRRQAEHQEQKGDAKCLRRSTMRDAGSRSIHVSSPSRRRS